MTAATSARPVRIGAVSYLNSKPLIEGLETGAHDATPSRSQASLPCRAEAPLEVVLDYPSRLADDLAAGRLDVALIPSFEYLRHPEYQIVSDACVASHGPVLSVKLYSRVPMGEIRRLALDEGSRTSAALARVMLLERYGVEPQLESLPLGLSTDATEADAVLLIGDRAMHLPTERFAAVWDLGQEWLDWTGLPFVFALWAARREADLGDVEESLCSARDRGVARLEEIARREAPRLKLSEKTAIGYLTENLHYRLGSAERNGLQLFLQLATQRGLVPKREVPLGFRDCLAAR